MVDIDTQVHPYKKGSRKDHLAEVGRVEMWISEDCSTEVRITFRTVAVEELVARGVDSFLISPSILAERTIY